MAWKCQTNIPWPLLYALKGRELGGFHEAGETVGSALNPMTQVGTLSLLFKR